VIHIKNNFLPKEVFQQIKNILISDTFPWYYKSKMTTIKGYEEKLYFLHNFYVNNQPNSEHYVLIQECLKKLNCNSLIHARANLSLNFKERYYCNWHTDRDFDCKIAILYINTNNGYTEIKDNDKVIKVNCEENKIVVFDSNHLHRMVSQTDTENRVVINLNYI
jgi:hypothetical protein